jgi:hypothetical protein
MLLHRYVLVVHFLIPQGRLHRENLIVDNLVFEFPLFYRILMFIALSTRIHHWALYRVRQLQWRKPAPHLSDPYYYYPPQCLYLSSVIPYSLETEILYTFLYLLSLLCKIAIMMCRAHLNFNVWVAWPFMYYRVFSEADRMYTNEVQLTALICCVEHCNCVCCHCVVLSSQSDMHYWTKYKHMNFSGNFLLGLNICELWLCS